MRVIRNRPEWNQGAHLEQGAVVAIGNFDGLHRGHRALIEKCHEIARGKAPVAVVTFEPLPLAFFKPEKSPARLTTVYQKLGILRSLGVDLTWMVRFNQAFSSMSAREFAQVVLAQRLNARTIVVGGDFRFGRGQEGDVAFLEDLGRELGFNVVTVAAVTHDGERISSSGVRERLTAGDFEGAAEWLGRPFRMEGHVVRGAALGRKLGYPTANLKIRSEPSPLGGVLAVYSRIGDRPWLPAVANLGRRPVVNGKTALLEVHFFDFDEDIYGQRLDVQFVAKLREETNFESLDALVGQMKLDEHEARNILAETPVPD
jgi:riboflavin kinase/FMN adenylyltransferase